jgi:hypothetical protein
MAIKMSGSFSSVYALGWDYATPRHNLFKALLKSPNSPFKLRGIVHKDTYVTEVDGFPLIRTVDFEKLASQGGISAVLLSINEEFVNLAYRYHVPLVTPDTLIHLASQKLEKSGISINLGPISIPEVFSGELSTEGFEGVEAEPTSQLYAAYVEFQKNGLLQELQRFTLPKVSLPVAGESFLLPSESLPIPDNAVILEISDGASTLFEQCFFSCAGKKSVQYLRMTSEENTATFRQQIKRLDNIFSVFHAGQYFYLCDSEDDDKSFSSELQIFQRLSLKKTGEVLSLAAVHLIHIDIPPTALHLFKVVQEILSSQKLLPTLVVRVGKSPHQFNAVMRLMKQFGYLVTLKLYGLYPDSLYAIGRQP